jgi:hypothetical protein
MKLFFGMIGLACGSLALANSNVPYPKENVAQFVVEKLDVTTLPFSIRPKPEKRKKTFGDYGYVTRRAVLALWWTVFLLGLATHAVGTSRIYFGNKIAQS